MSHHQTMSKKTKPLFRGLVASAMIGLGSIAMVGVKAADPPAAPDRGEVQSAEPMVPLPRAVVKGLADKGVSNVALVDHEGGIQQVLALSSDGDSKVNMNPPEPSQIGGQGESQVPEPMVKLSPELVTRLTERAIWNLALLDHSGGIKQVLALFPGGRCEACAKIQGEVSDKVGVLNREGVELLDLAIGRARAAHICPKDCICAGGNCRNRLGSCCPC